MASSSSARRSTVLVLVLCVIVLITCLAPTAVSAAGNSTRFQKPYNVCTSDWAPIVRCADIEDPKDYDGFQIALWRKVAEDMGWADGDWTFSCVDWTAMIDDLQAPNGLCSFAAAGVEVSLPNIVAGLKFSWPIYKSGFHVLIASNVEEGGIWAFAQAFHWSVWVSLGATAIAVSVIITAAELLAGGERANRKGLRGWSWYCMSKMVQVVPHVGDPKTWASRILVLGYAFMVLIMVHLFTATTASKMTMQRLANDISSKADLPGKKVESWEPYVPLLRKYSIDATALPWDNDEDTETMLNNLRTHKYQALILDSPVVQYFASQAPLCDLYPVGDPFETFNLAIAFPPDVPDALPAAISASIVRLQTTSALLDELDNTYIKSAGHSEGGAGCAKQLTAAGGGGGGHSTSSSISLEQVLGLWFILLFCLAGSAVLTFVSALRKPHRRRAMADFLLCRRHTATGNNNRVAVAGGAAEGVGGPGAAEGVGGPGADAAGECEVNVVGLGRRGGRKGVGGDAGLPGVSG